MQRRRWLPGDRAFRALLETQIAHAAGDALVAVALANTLFFSVTASQARSKVGLYLVLTMTPFAVLSPVVGPLLDRFHGAYKAAIVASAGGRAILAALLSTRTDRLWLYPLAFGSLVLSRAHGVGRAALVPETLPQDRTLVWGNAWLAVVSVGGAMVFGAPGAGINHWLGPEWTLRFAAVAFVCAGAFALALPAPARTGKRADNVGDFRSMLTPRLLSAGVGTAAMRGAVGFLTFTLAFVLRAGGHAGKGFAAVVLAAAGGGFLASAVTPSLRRVLHESSMLVLASLSSGLVALWAASPFGIGRAALVAGVTGLGAGMARLAFDSMLQRDAPEAIRARTFARYETIFQLFWVGGAGLATAIPFGAANGLRAMAAICFAGVVTSFIRFVRTAPVDG